MTLTSTYQYLGRSAALKSQNGSYSYYLLLYGASSGLVASGSHHISIKLRLACTEGSSFYGFATSGAASAGGQSAFSWSWEMNPNAPWNTTALTEGGVTYPRWIDLREDAVQIYTGYGAEKTVDLSGSFTFCDGTSGYLPQKSSTVTATVSCVLPAIAGASKPSCAATCQLGSPLAITVTGQSGLSHTLRYRFGSAEGVIDGSTWTPSLDLAYQIPYATSGTATISCDTYSGSTLIGTEQTTVTLTVPESVVPTVSADISDASGAEELVKCLVQNYSKLKVVPDAQGIYGSTILSTAVLLDGKAYSGGILTESGDHTITVTANDSRGRTASEDYLITVAPYQAPTLTLSASRCTADGTADEAGDHAMITATGSITELAGENEAAMTLYWGSSSQSYGNVTGCSKIVEADVNTTMAIRATLSDKLITTERSMTLSTGYATLDLLAGGKGIAFGKAATRAGFDCAMPAFFTGGVSGIEASDVGAAPSGYGLGTGGVYNSSVDSVFNGGFYRWDGGNDQTPFSYGTMLVVPRAKDSSAAQLAFCSAGSSKGTIATRVTTASSVGSWETLNPILTLGSDYRTVFKRKSKTVFQRLLSFGTLPASGSKTKDTGLSFADFEPVDFSIRLMHSSNNYVYSHVPGLTFGFQKGTTNWDLAATVTEDLSAYTVEVLIYYVTKG